MAESVGCGVDEKRCVVAYNRSSKDLAKCTKKDFSFSIEPQGDNSVGVFRITVGGNVLRENISDPFPNGAFSKESVSLNDANYNVTLKKNTDAKIGEYFKN